MKNKMLMVGAVSLVSLMTNVGFACSAPVQCIDDGFTKYVCKILNGADPRWVNVNASVAQVPTKDGLLVRAVATSDQCCPNAEIADESGGVLGGSAPVPASKGYKMGALGYCFSRSTSTGSMWNQAADLIPISKGTE